MSGFFIIHRKSPESVAGEVQSGTPFIVKRQLRGMLPYWSCIP